MKAFSIQNLMIIAFASIAFEGCGGDSAPAKNSDPKVQAAFEKMAIAGSYDAVKRCNGSELSADVKISIAVSAVEVVGIADFKDPKSQPCHEEVKGKVIGADEVKSSLTTNNLKITKTGTGCGTASKSEIPAEKEYIATVQKLTGNSYQIEYFGACLIANKR